jgi:Alkylmercury lyase
VDLEDLRLAVYHRFADTGRAPESAQLARQLDVSEGEVRQGLAELARARHVVLDPGGAIVMAHPFSQLPMGFSVMGRRTLWWGGCCWDAFAIPHLLPDEPDVLVATRCPGCDRPGAWVVEAARPPAAAAGEWLAHFLVPVAHIWDDVVHSCSNQRLFCSPGCIRDWLDRAGSDEGAVTDLPTLWRLASRWYEGRLDRGYVRRDPSEAADYLREVGLVGPFWGT